VTYFNGFSLTGEEALFDDYLVSSDMVVTGFSYGAIQAFEHTYSSSTRIDRLILISPAFFHHQSPAYKKTQLRYFKSNPQAYTEQFLTNITHPSTTDMTKYLSTGTTEELETLLHYQWDKAKLQELVDRGITIEVFLGGEDIIIDSESAFEFFGDVAVCYMVKGVGHVLG